MNSDRTEGRRAKRPPAYGRGSPKNQCPRSLLRRRERPQRRNTRRAPTSSQTSQGRRMPQCHRARAMVPPKVGSGALRAADVSDPAPAGFVNDRVSDTGHGGSSASASQVGVPTKRQGRHGVSSPCNGRLAQDGEGETSTAGGEGWVDDDGAATVGAGLVIWVSGVAPSDGVHATNATPMARVRIRRFMDWTLGSTAPGGCASGAILESRLWPSGFRDAARGLQRPARGSGSRLVVRRLAVTHSGKVPNLGSDLQLVLRGFVERRGGGRRAGSAFKACALRLN